MLLADERRTRNLLTVRFMLLWLLLFGCSLQSLAENPSTPWRVSPRLARAQNPMPADEVSLANGKKTFDRECQLCHGALGKGDGPAAKALNGRVANLTREDLLAQSDGTIFTKIRTGRTPMPSFKDHLPPDEVWHLVNYIRSGFRSVPTLSVKPATTVAKSPEEAHAPLYKKAEFPSAQECGGCHMQIYKEWSVSRHAFAQTSPTFLAYQATLVKLTKGTLGDFCERCHTQVGMYSGEPILTNNSNRAKVPMEGITCVVCHRVPEAYGKITGRLPLEPGDIKHPVYGPRSDDELRRILATHRDDPPKTHRQVRLLEQVSQPGFCARCHDVRLVNGVRFEDLFSEYKQTPAAKKGVTCQACHMGPVSGVPSEYPHASAAVVRGESTRPARRTNHMFAGPDSSVVHPGIFPINAEAQEFATPEEWVTFDVAAGWGTEAFERNVPETAKFPDLWADPEERIAARAIIDQQQALLAENRARGTTLLKNGYGLGEIKITDRVNDLNFEVEVQNLTDGHSAPSGLIAERNVFLQITVTDAEGMTLFQSGDLDPNGDVRDSHSKYVHNGVIPADDQLFNLRSPILVGALHSGQREQIIPANYSLNPLIFMRPANTAAVLNGGIPDLRLQKKSIEALGNRWASYHVPREKLTGRRPYRVNVKLVAGQLPPHLIDAISGAGFEYGLTARTISDKLIDLYRVLWEKSIDVD